MSRSAGLRPTFEIPIQDLLVIARFDRAIQ
jgi:hypothetical protein